MPWAYRVVWKTRPNGNPYQSRERYWVAPGLAKKPVKGPVDPKAEAQAALAERRAYLARVAKKPAAVVVTGAQRAAAKAAADRAALDAKKKAVATLWQGLSASAAAARASVAPSTPAHPKVGPWAVKQPGGTRVLTPGRPPVKTSPSIDDLDPRHEATLAAQIRKQQVAAAVKSAADAAAIIKKRDDKLAIATRPKNKWDRKSGIALEQLLVDARDRQVKSKGADVDPDWLAKVIQAYADYTEHVSAEIKKRNDHLKQFTHMVKGVLTYRSLDAQNAAEAYMKSSGYTVLMGEARRLWGKDLKQRTGSFTPAWSAYQQVTDTQRFYVRDIAKSAFINGAKSPLERTKKMFEWNTSEKWNYIASLQDIKETDTGYDYEFDPLNGGRVGGHKRTVAEEFDHRQAQYKAEMDRRYAAAQSRLALLQVGLRNEGKLARDESYVAGPQREANRYIADSIKALGLTEEPQKIGMDVKERDRVVDDAAATWESTHIRFYQHMVKTDSGRMEMRFKSVKDQLAFEKQRDAFRGRLFKSMGSQAPAWYETAISQVPGTMPLGSVLGAVGSLPEVGFRLVIAASNPGGSRFDVPIVWNDLPPQVRKDALESSGGHMSSQQSAEYVKQWLTTPKGRIWFKEVKDAQWAETQRQNQQFLKDFYGEGDIWKKLDALSEFGASPTTDPVLNMISQFAFDPTVKLPFNFLTWGARYAHAMEVTSGLNKLKKVPKFLTAFQNVEEPTLRAKALAKVYKPLADAGEPPSKIVEAILSDLVKVGDEEGADAMRKRLRELGLEKRQISGELVLSQVQHDLRDVWSSMGVDYEDMLTKAKSKVAATEHAAKVKAAREARSPALGVVEAREAAREASREAEMKAAREATKARRERVLAGLRKRVESPAPSRLATEVPAPLEREVEHIVYAGPGTSPLQTEIPPSEAAHLAHEAPPVTEYVPSSAADVAWEGARPEHALDTVVSSTVSSEATTSLRDLIIETNPYSRSSGARAEGRVVAPHSEAAQAAQMAAIHGAESVHVVYGAQFARGPYLDALRETERFKGYAADLDEPVIREEGIRTPGFAKRRAAQIERKGRAQRWMYEHGRQSVARNLQREGRLRAEGGGLDAEGRIEWVRNAEGEAYTVVEGVPSHRQPIANRATLTTALSGAMDESEEMQVLLEREGVESLLKTLFSARARLGAVDRRGRPAAGSLSFEEYADIVDRVERTVVIRRNTALTIDMRAGEGSLVELNELDFWKAQRAESGSYIRVGEQMVEDLKDYDTLGHYYESFSVLPGMNDGPGYATGLMEQILTPSWRRSLGRPGFSKMLNRTVFSSVPAGPVAFRQNGAHLNALFQHIMLDDWEAFEHIRQARDDLMTGKITEAEYHVAFAKGMEMSNGGVRQLHDLGQTVRVYLTKDKRNPFLHMWLVLESRAGVHWADEFLDSEGAFLADFVGVKDNRIHPNMALAMIPYSPLARSLPTTFGFTGHLRSLATSTNGLFRGSLASWTDDVVIDQLQALYHARDGAQAGVTRSSQIIHYLMSRYGDTITRKHLTDVRRDLSIQRAFDVRDAGQTSQKAWSDFRKAYVRMKLEAQTLAGVVEGTDAVTRQALAREFDGMFTGPMPFEKAVRREFTPEVRELFDRLYWDGKITHDNAGLHTMAFFERMGHPRYQRGDDYVRYVESYYSHMNRAGDVDDAHVVVQEILKSEIGQTNGEAFEALTHMGESAGPLPKVSYGRLRRFLYSNGFLQPMENLIVAGKQREHVSQEFAEAEQARLLESNENLLDLHDADVLVAEGRRTAYDGATAENLVGQAHDLADRISVNDAEMADLAKKRTVLSDAVDEMVAAEQALKEARAGRQVDRLRAGTAAERRLYSVSSLDEEVAAKRLEEATDRAHLLAAPVAESVSVQDEIDVVAKELADMRGKATKGEVRSKAAHLKALKAYLVSVDKEAAEARRVVRDAVPRPDEDYLDSQLDILRAIGAQEEPSKAQPLFGSQGIKKYLASLGPDERPWVILRYREEYLKGQVSILMSNFNRRIEDMESLPAHLADEMTEIVSTLRGVRGGEGMLRTWAMTHAKAIEKSHMSDYFRDLAHFRYTEEVEHAARLVGRADESFPEGYFAMREVVSQSRGRLAMVEGTLERGFEMSHTEAGGDIRVQLSAERRAALEAEAKRLARDVEEGTARLEAAPVVDERELANLRKLYKDMPEADLVKMVARQPGEFSDYPAYIARLEHELDFIERGLVRGEKVMYGGAPFPRWLTKAQKAAARERLPLLRAELANTRAAHAMELEHGRAKPGRGEMHNARLSAEAGDVVGGSAAPRGGEVAAAAAATPPASGQVLNMRDAPKGWETNPDYVYVGRAGKGHSGEWGNPFAMKGTSPEERASVIAKYKEWILKQPGIEKRLEALRGKKLVCFCSPLACHADVLTELANRVEPLDLASEQRRAAGVSEYAEAVAQDADWKLAAEARDGESAERAAATAAAEAAGKAASRGVPIAKVPIVRSVDELTELVANEPELFMRWTPDLRADMQPGAHSSALDPFQGIPNPEIGISSLPVPFARGTAAEAIISPVGAAKYDLGPAHGDFAYRRGGRAGTAGYKRRTAWMVRGKIVGYGIDGEPLLDPTSIVPVAAVSRATVDEYVNLHRAGKVGGRGTVFTGGVPPAVAGVTRRQQFQHAIDEVFAGREAVDPDTGHPVDTSNRNAALADLHDRMKELGSAGEAKVIPRSTDFTDGGPTAVRYSFFEGPYGRPEMHQSNSPTIFFQIDYGAKYFGPMSKIHVAANAINGQEILRIVDAIARDMGVTYKWVKTKTELFDGETFGKGGIQQGKFITAYPDPSIAAEFTRRLDEALQNARITGGEVAQSERRYAPDSPITHRYVPDMTEGGSRFAPDGDYAANPDYIGFRKGSPEDLARDPVAAAEAAGAKAAAETAAGGAGAAPPPPGPEIPHAPDPLDLASERVSVSRHALDILSGMSEEDYIARELNKAWRTRRLAKTTAARSAAATRISELEKSMRVVRWEKAGRRGSLGGTTARRTKSSRVRSLVGKRAQAMFAARSIAPLIFVAGGAAVEQGRAYYRIWKTSEENADIVSRVRATGPVSDTYKSHAARIEKAMSAPVFEPSLGRYGFRANQLAAMTYTEFVTGWYQFERSARSPAFSAWVTEFMADLDKRLARISEDPSYTRDRWLSDRLQVRDTDHFDPKLFEEVEPEVVGSIHAERPGEMRTTKTDLKKVPGDIPPDAKVLSELVEEDIRAVVGRNKALAARGIDPHAYGEAWKVLRKPLQSKRYSLDLLRQAKEEAVKVLYAAGHGVDDADWDAVFRKEQNRQFILLRQKMADAEALKLLDKLTNAMVGATPRQIIEEFERRYGMDLEIKEFQPPQVTHFQKRTLEEAAKFHLQVTDLNDNGQLVVALRAHGQKPPFTNRAAMRQWLVDYGFWSPRTADAIDSGKASWSIQKEDEYFRLSWGNAPEWADVTLLEEGGRLRDAVLFNEVERARLYREWGSFTRNMKARFETGDMTRGERARFLVEGSAELDVKPKRDLWMERRYVKERFGDLAWDKATDRLTAFPELMTPDELADFISARGVGNVPERVFQSPDELSVFRQVVGIHMRRYLAAHPYAGKTASWSDFFHYTSAIAHDVLQDPIFLARDRDQIGSLLKLQAAIRRAMVFTQIGFVMLNALDTGIKGPWANWQLRSFATGTMSDVAANLTVKKMGWDPGGQLLHDLGRVGSERIANAFTRERKLFDMAGTVVEENDLDRALMGALEVAIGFSELPAQGSRAAENFAKLRLAQRHYDGVLAMYLKDGHDPEVAHALTISFLNHEIGRLWPTAGDGPLEKLFNQLSPFASYQFKNRLVYIGELASHPVLFNYFDHIGDIIEKYNRDRWERDHPGEMLPDYLARLIELPWAPGTFIDLGQVSDIQRGFKTATDVLGGKATLQSLAANFIRLAGPNDINFVEGWANALHWGTHMEWVESLDANGEPNGQWHQVESLWQAPWGGDANWLNSFWPVEVATQLDKTIKGQWNATELTKLMYQTMFFGGLKSYDRGAGLNGFYWALKQKDPEAAKKWLDESPQGSDLRTWWVEKVPDSKTGYTPQGVLDILNPPTADPNKWLHDQPQAYQDHITGLLDQMKAMRKKWDNVIADLAPGSKEFSNALMGKQNERYAFINAHPELYDFYAGSMTYDDWAKQLDEWQVDDLTQTFYNFARPVRKDGESEKDFQKRMAQYVKDKADYLRMFPQVADRINDARNVTEAVWQAVEDHWFTDILTTVGTTQIAIDAARQAKNFNLSDQLYLMKDLQSEGLNEETAVEYFNPITDYKPLTAFDKERGRDQQLRSGPFGQRLLPKAMVLPDMQTWLYNRADPGKQAKMRRDDRYAREIQDVIAKAKKSGNFPKTFVELIKGNPWLMAEYFRRNKGKREAWATNDTYIRYMGKYHSFIAKGDFTGADKYFDSLPSWAQDKYLNKHPKQRAFRANQRENLKYISLMKRWSDFYRHRDYAGGARFFDRLPQWAKDRYYAKHPTGFGRGGGGTGSSPYSRAMGKWVKLLQDNKDAEAKAYFNSLPQAYKDRYYSTHPEAKIRNDIRRVGQLADYFGADDANRVQYLQDNPEFAKWLKAQGNTEQTRRMLIMAGYQSIPSDETWKRRVYREQYPEVFSKEAAGARAIAKVTATLAEHPDLMPAFKKWLELVLSTYAEELKHVKAPPKPLTITHLREHGMTGRQRPHGGKSAAWVRLHSLS